jgi:hypothetical protein
MWLLTIRGPSSSPVEIKIKPGNNTIGRKPDNDIVITDESASRNHFIDLAELNFNARCASSTP